MSCRGEARREWVHQRLVARDPARLIAGVYLPAYRRGEHMEYLQCHGA
jgi:hypothetical protein